MSGAKRVCGTATALAAMVSAVGCGVSISIGSSSSLEDYAAQADEICLTSYHHGIDGEASVEETAKEQGWSDAKTEAEIRYAWAEALHGEYTMLADLGAPPSMGAVFERWHRTVQERARIYHLWGEAWAVSDRGREGRLSTRLDLAKEKADHLAEPLPFHVCGTRPPGSKVEHPTAQQLHEHPTVLYTAELPLRDRKFLKRGLGVYWYHHRAGEVLDLAPGSDTILAQIKLKHRFARKMIGSTLQLFQSEQDPSVSWLTIVPQGNR